MADVDSMILTLTRVSCESCEDLTENSRAEANVLGGLQLILVQKQGTAQNVCEGILSRMNQSKTIQKLFSL